MARAAKPLIGSKVLANLVLNNFAMKRLIAAAPALREIAMLESVRQIVAANPGRRVVVDMPATSPADASINSVLNPRRSPQRKNIRKIISAQS